MNMDLQVYIISSAVQMILTEHLPGTMAVRKMENIQFLLQLA